MQCSITNYSHYAIHYGYVKIDNPGTDKKKYLVGG